MLLASLWPVPALPQEAECAEVKIVIEQKLSLERQAFDARMVIRNGMDASALDNIRVELTYLDQNQQPVAATTDPNAAGAVFFQRTNQMSGIQAVDGSASLAAKGVADIQWLIIPAQGAGGDSASGRMYYIGAKVTYTLNGETTTVDVTPDYVMVRPQPLLTLDYFLPTDVHGDDPFTPETELPEPFTLGVRILNAGAGVSAKTSIESAQPKIVENRQGLLIDFQILGGYVGNSMQGKSLLLDFGDIPGRQAKMGRWLMQTSLSGRFVEFNASYTHADSLGGAVTSLLKEVRTHKLVRDVLVDLAGHDDVADFLAEAGDGLRVFDSLGGDAEVIDASQQASLASAGNGNQRMRFTPAPGLVYAKVSDPFDGAKPVVRVVRSDGKVLPPQNFWLSKTRKADLSWSYAIQIFDSGSTGDYVLEFSQGGSAAALSGEAYRDANANGVRDAGEAAEGNLAVTLKGVDDRGQNVLLTAHTDANGAFSFSALVPGRYRLEAASVNGWVDGAWAAGSAGGTAQPGSIADIVLAAGSLAQGYRIAKRPPVTVPPPESKAADLSIALQAARAQLSGGETTSVTATVRNAGSDSAQAVVAQMAVPSGLSLQSHTASVGSYADGAWSIGELASAQDATLTLTVKANPVSGGKDAAISWPASVSSQTHDPQTANNSALLGLTVQAEPSTAELSQSLPAYADVLMLVSCAADVPAGLAACESAAKQQAQTSLAHRRGLQPAVAACCSRQAGCPAVRGGACRSAAWCHLGGRGRRHAGAAATGRRAGARMALPALGSEQAVKLQSDATEQGTAGLLHGLEALAGDSVVMARSASGGVPVMASHPFGLGQAWVLGFDLLQSLNGASAAFWDGFLSQRLGAITPAARHNPALAGARLAVKATARSRAAAGEAAQNLHLRMLVPAGASHEDAVPTPAQSEPEQVQWAMRLEPAQSAAGEITLVLPQTSANLQLQTALLDTAEAELDSQTLSIQVLGLDSLMPRIDAALLALGSTAPETQVLIQQARDAVAAATAEQQAQAPDWSAVLASLASLQSALGQLAQAPHSLDLGTLPLEVARWFGLVQTRWQPGAGTAAAQVLAQSGADQSSPVEVAFAAPLIAKVTDAQGAPVAGVRVRFQLPAAGASALFAGGGLAADAVSDAQGLAESPCSPPTPRPVPTRPKHVCKALRRQPALRSSTCPAARCRQACAWYPAWRKRQRWARPLRSPSSCRRWMPKPSPCLVPASPSNSRPQVPAPPLPVGSAAPRWWPMPRACSPRPSSPPTRWWANTTPAFLPTACSPAGAAGQPGHGGGGTEFEATTATGTGIVKARISGGGDTCVFNPSATRTLPPQGIWTPLQPFLLPHGLLEFELTGCQVGGEVSVSVTWPDLRGITGYLKYGPTPQSRGRSLWYAPHNLRIQGNTVSYTIRDGGLGDDDLAENGTIRDPGGPVTGRSSADSPQPVPALHPAALALLALLLGLLGWRRGSRAGVRR
ncbi:hypothetical protein FQR65_LT08002 [Abscondita terminalis]|nr:hypothetical protein FQR65_LT08002 [Abscondita terminalis]